MAGERSAQESRPGQVGPAAGECWFDEAEPYFDLDSSEDDGTSDDDGPWVEEESEDDGQEEEQEAVREEEEVGGIGGAAGDAEFVDDS